MVIDLRPLYPIDFHLHVAGKLITNTGSELLSLAKCCCRFFHNRLLVGKFMAKCDWDCHYKRLDLSNFRNTRMRIGVAMRFWMQRTATKMLFYWLAIDSLDAERFRIHGRKSQSDFSTVRTPQNNKYIKMCTICLLCCVLFNIQREAGLLNAA